MNIMSRNGGGGGAAASLLLSFISQRQQQPFRVRVVIVLPVANVETEIGTRISDGRPTVGTNRLEIDVRHWWC